MIPLSHESEYDPNHLDATSPWKFLLLEDSRKHTQFWELRVPVFSIRLQPRDQDPVTYIIPFPGPFSILSPRGTFFSYYAQVRMLTLLNNCYMIFSLQILFTSGIQFLCV
jgi:hypothetical protein